MATLGAVALAAAACASGSGGGGTYREAELVSKPATRVPRGLYGQGHEGYVVVRYTIDASGRVVDPVVVESEPGVFDERVLAALREYRFRPARSAGRNVASRRLEVFPFCNPSIQQRTRERPELCRGPRNRSAFYEGVYERHVERAREPEADAEGPEPAPGDVNAGTPEATPGEPR